MGPPLRPSTDDLALAARSVEGWKLTTGRRNPTLLLMGVTPELCALPSIGEGRVVAIDRSREMIESVWPGRLRRGDRALCGEWSRLPLRSGSMDLVLSDGCFTNLAFPEEYRIVLCELRRVLREEGRVFLRLFVQGIPAERPARVLSDLRTPRVGGFHAFKWRLAMSLQPSAEEGVALRDVWEALYRAEPDLEALAARCAWPLEEVATIDAYRGVSSRYTFPTLAEVRDLLDCAGFTTWRTSIPGYELGDRCPSLELVVASR